MEAAPFYLNCKCHDAFWSEYLDCGLKEIDILLKATHKFNADMEARELWKKIKDGVVNLIIFDSTTSVATLKTLKGFQHYDWGHFEPSIKCGQEKWPLS